MTPGESDLSEVADGAQVDPLGKRPHRDRFLKAQHLRRPVEFQRVYDLKQRASDSRLLIFAAPNDLGLTRIGFSVSRKHGNAVRRHRLKRLMREAFRLAQHEIPSGLDLVLIPQAGAAPGVTGYQDSLKFLAIKLARRISQRPRQETRKGSP